MRRSKAISDIGTMLYGKKSGDTAYAEVVEIKDVPDTGSDPEQLDKTTLKDKVKTYIMGRQDSPTQSFTYNYDEDQFHTQVLPYCDGNSNTFLVVFPDGSGYTVTGIASTYVKGYSANSVIEAVLTITAEEIDFLTAAEVTALIS